MNKFEALETLEQAARIKSRSSLLAFVQYINHDYIVNWHHALLCSYLDKFARGEIKRLMVFMPPQHGKEISDNTLVLTPNGFINHGEINVGNYVYGRDGQPVKVVATSKDCISEYDITFSDGEVIQCHGNHEWVVYDRSTHKERIVETKYLSTQKLNSGESKRGNRNRFQVDINTCISFKKQILPINAYVLGAWLGDGSTTKNCITHSALDIDVINKIISLGYSETHVSTHKDTGVKTTYFTKLYGDLMKAGILKNTKRIPEIYLLSSISDRLELLAGLIDTDGYIYHKNGRVTFSNINKELIHDIKRLVISLGCRVTISEFEPKLSTSGIQGRNKVYQLCFNPNFHIPCALERKKTININPCIRKRGIISVIKSTNPKKGKCIQVEGGIYLVGESLIPTHNSQLVSRSLPAYLLGKKPDSKIVVASYSSDLSSTFNRDCQRIIEQPEYKDVFPGTRLNKTAVVSQTGWLRNSDIFQIVGYKGFFKAVGVGGALTGTTADYAIIDDPVKDSMEAMSSTFQVRNWNWYNDVLFTRINNDSGILITQTRWDERDLSGLIIKSMNEGRGEKWTILSLPAVKEDNTNEDDPRQIGDALWPEKHSLEKLRMIQNSNLRTFQSLYQQNPQPTETGGEFYKQFKIWRNVKDFDFNPELTIHLSFDFNVNPAMHASVWHIVGKKAYQIAEIVTATPRNNTKGVCDEFKRLYPYHNGGLIIYGDPSGKNEDTRSEKGFNDYTIIMRELSDYKPSKRVPTAHPSVRMRGNFINTIFEQGYEGLEINIGSKCVKTIEDLQFIKEDSDGTKLKEKAKDLATGISYEKWGHLSDAMDYMITEAFKSEYSNYQRGGKEKFQYVMGKDLPKQVY